MRFSTCTIAFSSLARVAALGESALAPGTEAWLVWEGQHGATFLTRDTTTRRALITLPKSKVERMEVVGFDPILRRLFASSGGAQ